jgi:hypothetical protein
MADGQEIARRVEQVIAGIPARARRLGIDANGGWTLLMKNQLLQLGDEMDYQVCTAAAAPVHDDSPPWAGAAYDLSWLPRANDGKDVARVPLVFETGWHSSREEQIDADFQELLSARADVRVGVFQQRKAAAVQAVMDTLERQARAREATGPAR